MNVLCQNNCKSNKKTKVYTGLDECFVSEQL